MKRYLKFAASFWVSAFLVAGSMAMAQTTSTAKANEEERKFDDKLCASREYDQLRSTSGRVERRRRRIRLLRLHDDDRDCA